MRKGILLGKDFYLTEKQWSQSVGRFDVDKAKEHTDTFKIKVRCFCDELECSECPLSVFKTATSHGCGRAIEEVVGREISWAFRIGMSEVYWWKEKDERARKQVQQVYSFLMSMKQVRFKGSG